MYSKKISYILHRLLLKTDVKTFKKGLFTSVGDNNRCKKLRNWGLFTSGITSNRCKKLDQFFKKMCIIIVFYIGSYIITDVKKVLFTSGITSNQCKKLDQFFKKCA